MIDISFKIPMSGWELFHLLGVLLFGATHRRAPAATHGPADEQLVTLFQQGDQQAFELLVQRYQNLAFTVCRRYLGNAELAEETAQDVFIAIYRKLGDFRQEASFKSYFYTVLVNHCRNRHKARTRRQEGKHDSLDGPIGEDEWSARELPDPGHTPESAFNQQERQRLMEHALEGLPEEARMILLLREGQGMPYEDIGTHLGLAAGTVKSRLHRARADLKLAVTRLMGETP